MLAAPEATDKWAPTLVAATFAPGQTIHDEQRVDSGRPAELVARRTGSHQLFKFQPPVRDKKPLTCPPFASMTD
jgi:hypothetical protein